MPLEWVIARRASATRYAYRRHTAEKRASKPSRASEERCTATSEYAPTTPQIRAASTDAGPRTRRPAVAARAAPILRLVEIDVGDLPGRMNAGIGPTRDDEPGLTAEDACERVLDRALHGAQPGCSAHPRKCVPS